MSTPTNNITQKYKDRTTRSPLKHKMTRYKTLLDIKRSLEENINQTNNCNKVLRRDWRYQRGNQNL